MTQRNCRLEKEPDYCRLKRQPRYSGFCYSGADRQQDGQTVSTSVTASNGASLTAPCRHRWCWAGPASAARSSALANGPYPLIQEKKKIKKKSDKLPGVVSANPHQRHPNCKTATNGWMEPDSWRSKRPAAGGIPHFLWARRRRAEPNLAPHVSKALYTCP